MSKIIPVNITTTEQAVTLDATYQFVWLRNMGENDCLLSDHSDIVAGDDNVTLVKAGESGRIATSGRAVYIKAVSGASTGEIHAQNFSDVPFRSRAKGGGQSITVEPLTVTDNGVYTAPQGKAYSPVSVDVQEEPWKPLEDGYSNFWFELTNDTLSPWLNFGAKNNDAVIDWGDGSGEQALTTLTPTHTYSKAGRYIVKVKGVTGIGAQIPNSYDGAYIQVLRHIELNNEIATINNYAFQYTSISEATIPSSVSTIGSSVFRCCGNLNTLIDNSSAGVVGLGSYCTVLRNLSFGGEITSIGSNSFYQCVALDTVTIPSSVESIGNLAFAQCQILRTIHVQAITPPTLGTTPFNNIANDFIIYVPVGTAETYKSASGWSTYADHIVEEGQQPNRAMLAKFNSAKTDEPQDDMR